MNGPPPAWHSTLHGIILHPSKPRALVQPEIEGWSLPRVRLEERVWLPHPGPFLEAIQGQLGTPVAVLRYAYADVDREAGRIDAAYVLESRDPGWCPPEAWQWVGRAELTGLPLSYPEQRAVIDSCLAEDETGTAPPLRSPWARRGWYREATTWIAAQLAQLGETGVGPVEQIKSWGISTILRVPTAAGRRYFKAIPPASGMGRPAIHASAAPTPPPLLFANEPALIAALSALYPGHIPAPLAIDRERRWMLLAEFGEELRDRADVAAWTEALRAYARLQVASVERVDALFAAGCLDRRLETLAGQIDPLLGDADALTDLTEAEIAELRARAPLLKELCDRLAGYRVPQTLVHGDLHAGNIAVGPDGAVFFDWTDGCVAHPFLDLVTFWDNSSALSDLPDAQARLRDAYLAQWTAYEPPERLAEACALAEILGALHQAVSYRHILANLEATARRELSGALPFWLRTVLTALGGSVPFQYPPRGTD